MKRLMIITLGILGIGTAHAADTCVPTTFNVTYSCGDGTLVGTLPENQVIKYGGTLSVSWLNKSICNPPAGSTVIRGVDVYSGDKLVGYFYDRNSSRYSFTFYYTTDVVVMPHYLVDVASIADVAVARDPISNNCNYRVDTERAMWENIYPFGLVRGVAKVVGIAPLNTVKDNLASFIPIDQEAIENSENISSGYCYCKMTEPYLEDSPWVYSGKQSTAHAGCLSECSYYNGSCRFNYQPWRASMGAAAIKKMLEQAQQQE